MYDLPQKYIEWNPESHHRFPYAFWYADKDFRRFPRRNISFHKGGHTAGFPDPPDNFWYFFLPDDSGKRFPYGFPHDP